MRHLLLLVLPLVGCDTLLRVEPPPAYTFTPLVSAVTGVVVTVGDSPSPGPGPVPPVPPGPGPRECDACGGTGEVGDGTIKIICNICGGDGVLDGALSSDDVVTGPVTVGNVDSSPPVDQDSGSLQADYLTSPVITYASESFEEATTEYPQAIPLLVFFWPSEVELSKIAIENLEKRNNGQYIVIPLCLSDKWDEDTYVAEYWKLHTRAVVRLDGDKRTRILDLKQLEK